MWEQQTTSSGNSESPNPLALVSGHQCVEQLRKSVSLLSVGSGTNRGNKCLLDSGRNLLLGHCSPQSCTDSFGGGKRRKTSSMQVHWSPEVLLATRNVVMLLVDHWLMVLRDFRALTS